MEVTISEFTRAEIMDEYGFDIVQAEHTPDSDPVELLSMFTAGALKEIDDEEGGEETSNFGVIIPTLTNKQKQEMYAAQIERLVKEIEDVRGHYSDLIDRLRASITILEPESPE